MKTTTTKQVFENVETTTTNNVKAMFESLLTYPKRDEGNHQVTIKSFDIVGKDKKYLKLEGVFTDNQEPFEDLTPFHAKGTTNRLSPSMMYLIRELTSAYFSGQDFSQNPLELFNKIVGQTLTIVISYNEEFTNYNYLPTQASEQIEL